MVSLGISFAGTVSRLPPGPLRRRLAGLAAVADEVLTGRGERAQSQRIALAAYITRVVSAVIGLASQALLARWMGDHQYGIFVFVWVAAVIVGGFACLGFQLSIVRFIPEYLERRTDGLLRGILVGARLYGMALATAFAVAGATGLYFFGAALPDYYLVPLYLALVCLPMLAVGEIQEGIGRAFNWTSLSLGPTFIYRPLLILLAFWLAVRLGYAADAITAMAATTVATYAVTGWQALALRRRIRRTVAPGPRVYASRAWVAVTLPIFVIEGIYNLLTNVDIIIVGVLVEPGDVAVYFAAVKVLAIVHYVFFAVRAAAAARMSRYHASGDRRALAAFTRETLHWTFWPSLAAGAMLLLAGWPLLALFGPEFTAGYPLLFIFMVGLVARASIGAAESLLTMAGQQRICAIVYALVFVINVGLILLLVPPLGLVGAATATAAALVIESIALYVLARERLGIRPFIGFALMPASRPAAVL